MVKRIIFLFLFLLLVMQTLTAIEDYRTRIAVVPMKNKTGDPYYDVVGMTVTDTITLVLRALEKHMVIDQEDNQVLNNIELDDVKKIGEFCDDNKYDQIVYGSAALKDDGSFVFSLSLYDNAEKKIVAQEEASARSILGVFDAADEITTGIISHIGNIHIGFGSIELKVEQGTGEYSVFLNEKKVRNPTTLFKKVLNGSYRIAIHQERLSGDIVIFEQQIDVYEDKPTLVSFTIPAASETDRLFVESGRKEILKLADNPAKIEELLTAIARFKETALKINYDKTFIAYVDESLQEIGKKTENLLIGRMQAADAKYYARRPDFEGALEEYRYLSGLVNDAYQFLIADPANFGDILEPFCVKTTPSGTFYEVDGFKETRLRSFSETGTQIALQELGTGQTEALYSFAADTASYLYSLNNSTGEISVYNRNLEPVRTFKVPDYTSSEENQRHIAVSGEQAVFIAAKDFLAVLIPVQASAKEFERDTFIEDALRNGLTSYPDIHITDIFFDSRNRLNIFSAESNLLLLFDSWGTFIGQVTLSQTEQDSGITCDSLGYYYITLPKEHRILKFSPKGEIVTSYGSYGINPGEFSQPRGVAVGSNGDLVVADYFNNRVQVFHPVAPPILLPQVSRYGILFSSRVEAAARAIKAVENMKARLKPENASRQFSISILSFGAAFGLAVGNDYFARQAVAEYGEYRTATDVQSIEDFKSNSKINWALGQTCFLGTLAAVGVGSSLLTSSLVTLIDSFMIRQETIRGLQNLSLDYRYETDVNKYKSLKKAQAIGVWTGLMPPLAGLTAGLAIAFGVPNFQPIGFSILTAASVVIPPIFSHLYGGKLNPGLVVSSLLADALAVGSLLLTIKTPPIHNDTETRYLSSDLTLQSTWEATVRNFLPYYMMISAFSIRITAGVYDMNHGWISTHNYNQYKAQAKTGPVVSMRILPIIDGFQNAGVLCSLQL
ncbi:MAG: NHL repeat-containing protein [Spirochaetota bacterium]